MKILVTRLSSLGDVVLTTALFPNLKAAQPEAEITILTRAAFAPVFQRNPFVDHVRLFDPTQQSFSSLIQEIRAQRFDVIIDLHANPRTWLLRLLAGAPRTVVVEKATLARWSVLLFKRRSSALTKSVRERILDCLKRLDIPVIHTETRLYQTGSDDLLRTHGLDPSQRLIGIAPGARYGSKRWPAQRFAQAGNRLGAFPNSMVVILGDRHDRAVAEEVSRLMTVPSVNLAGWTNLNDLIGIASRLSFLLTNDSGLMHIGEALRVPLVAIFGPTVRAFGFAPYRPTSRVVEVVNLPCRPCSRHGTDVCPLGHHLCMQDIDVSAVMFAASGAIEAGGDTSQVSLLS